MISLRRLATTPIVVATFSTGLVGCAAGSGSSAYNYDCPEQGLVEVALLDVSASGRNDVVLAERLDATQVAAEKAADCDAKFIAIAWSGSSSSSKVLFSGGIPIAGATEIGRDRKIPEAVSGVMGDVRANLTTAMREIDGDNSDLAGAFYLLGDVRSTSASQGELLEASVFTDAISTGGNTRINDPGLTKDRIESIVAQQSLPGLDGAKISVRGVGRVAGVAPPPQDYIQLVQEYASGMCMKTGAECSVFTTVISS